MYYFTNNCKLSIKHIDMLDNIRLLWLIYVISKSNKA